MVITNVLTVYLGPEVTLRSAMQSLTATALENVPEPGNVS